MMYPEKEQQYSSGMICLATLGEAEEKDDLDSVPLGRTGRLGDGRYCREAVEGQMRQLP